MVTSCMTHSRPATAPPPPDGWSEHRWRQVPHLEWWRVLWETPFRVLLACVRTDTDDGYTALPHSHGPNKAIHGRSVLSPKGFFMASVNKTVWLIISHPIKLAWQRMVVLLIWMSGFGYWGVMPIKSSHSHGNKDCLNCLFFYLKSSIKRYIFVLSHVFIQCLSQHFWILTVLRKSNLAFYFLECCLFL